MKKLLFILIPIACFAEGPMFRHKDPIISREFDNVYRDLRKIQDPVVTEWTAYTPTGGWNTNVTYTGFWRRVGDTMEVQFLVSCAGAPNNARPTISLPAGYTIDTDKLLSIAAADPIIGSAFALNNTGTTYPLSTLYNDTSSVRLNFLDEVSSVVVLADMADNITPFTFGADDELRGFFKVPISGWRFNE